MDKKWVVVEGGGDSREPTRTPDSLLSQDYFEVLLALSEGPIKGLVSTANNMENFFAGDTPVYNLATGQANFSDFSATLYAGTDTDSPIKLQLGGAAANVPISVALASAVPVVRQTPGIQRNQFDQIEVRLRFDYLVKTTLDGQFETTALFKIEYKRASSSLWKHFEDQNPISIKGKTSNGYARDFIIPVEKVNEDYDIRVTKVSPDGVQGVDDDVVNMTWESYQLVKLGDAQYPDLALMHIYGKASNQFTSIPEFSGIYDGLIVRVPTNYNPELRVYDESTPWNGTFKYAHTSNGPWILYELLTNERWGLSRYYKGVTVNRYEFYEEAKWCDQQVPDGRGGTQARFTYNDWITEARSGPETLKYIAGSFNAILDDDGNGYVTLRSDRPRQATQVFTPENVTPAGFSYTFTDTTSRYNDIRVAFINPDLDWEEDWRSATIDNTAAIAQNGRVPFDFVAVGCIDAYEAVRRANYRYVTSNEEITTASFVTARNGLLCNLLDTVYIADPTADWGNSARVKTATTVAIHLRDPMWFPDLLPRAVKVQTYEGLVELQITPSLVGENYTLNVVGGNFPVGNVPPNTVFTVEDMAGIGLSKPFRVIGIAEVDGKPDEIELTVHEIAVGKYEQVETGLGYVPSQYAFSTPGEAVLPPTMDITSPQPLVNSDGTLTYALEVSWRRPIGANTDRYEIDFKLIDDSAWSTVTSRGDRATLTPVSDGKDYVVRLYAVTPLGHRSQRCLEQTATVLSKAGALENVLGLAVIATPTGWEASWSAPTDIPDLDGTDIRIGTTATTDFSTLPARFLATSQRQQIPWLPSGVHRVMAKFRSRSKNYSGTAAIFDLAVLNPATPILEVDRGLDNTLLRFQDCTTSQPLRDILVRMGTDSSSWDTATETSGAGANQRAVSVLPNAVTITKVYVRARDVAGNLSNIAAETIPPATGDIQALLDLINIGITEDALSPSLLATINLITADASTAGSVAALVAGEASARSTAISTEVSNRNLAIADAEQRVTTAFGIADGQVLAAAQNYTYSKSQADGAIAGAINSYNAALLLPGGAIEAAVTEQAEAQASIDGHLGAQWAVKVGFSTPGGPAEIAGVAIAGTSVGTAGARFDMAFRANAFYFLPPSGQGDSLYQPMVYYPSNTVINGVTIPAGLYLKSAFIDYIKADQIDTRNLTIKDASGTILFSSGVNVDWQRINASQEWQNNEDSIIRAPGGGYLVTNSGTLTGSIKVRLPVWFTDTMITMFVDIYEYADGYSCTLQLSGYTYSGDSGWRNVSATVVSGSNVEYPVYFGHDGTKCCIWIDVPSSVWSYPQVRVRDVFLGYNSYSKDMWNDGWQVSLDTAFTLNSGSSANRYSAAILDTYPGADWSKTARRPANVAALSGGETIRNDQITLGSTGNISGIGTGNGASVANNRDSVITAPEGGMYVSVSGATSASGAIRIRLPARSGVDYPMLKFEVDIYEYGPGDSCKLQIAGHYSTSTWYNVSAQVIGGNVEYPVYFGNDGTYAVIWIGAPSESWAYPQIRVRDVFVGYNSVQASLWSTGWAISFDTSAPTNQTRSVADTYPGADWSKTARRPGNVAALSGSEPIRNDQIAVSGGAITGIGTGAGTTVANNLIGINGSGQLYGAGAGNGITVSNNQLSVDSQGRLYSAGVQLSGQVTFSGLGGGAMGLINQINSVNVNTYIAGAAIGLAKINTATITNLAALSATVGLLRTATSGGRVEIADNVIKVYDDSNVLRVKIGNLSL